MMNDNQLFSSERSLIISCRSLFLFWPFGRSWIRQEGSVFVGCNKDLSSYLVYLSPDLSTLSDFDSILKMFIGLLVVPMVSAEWFCGIFVCFHSGSALSS